MDNIQSTGSGDLKDPLTGKAIGAAIEVHQALGPGLLESTYQQALAHEMSLRDIQFEMEKSLSVSYKGICLDCGYRADFIVENCLVLELKAVESLTGVHTAQILTYMKHAEVSVGLIINFSEKLLKDGIRRFVL